MSSSEHALQEKAAQSLCASGCGFYSNAGTGGLCSKCHREAQLELAKAATSQQQQQQPEQQQHEQPRVPAASSIPVAPEVAPVATPSSSVPAPAEAKKPSPTRCWTCNKKVGLTGFSCKCLEGAVFCSTHRYAEAHACAFDYKSAAKQQLEAKNPLVQASKVDRI